MSTPATPSFEEIILASYDSVDPRILGGLQTHHDRVLGLADLVGLSAAALDKPAKLAQRLAAMDLATRGETAVVALVWLAGMHRESPHLLTAAALTMGQDARLVANLGSPPTEEVKELCFLAALIGPDDYEAAAAQLAFGHLSLDRVERTLTLFAGILAAAALIESPRRWLGRYREPRRYLTRLASLLAALA